MQEAFERNKPASNVFAKNLSILDDILRAQMCTDFPRIPCKIEV